MWMGFFLLITVILVGAALFVMLAPPEPIPPPTP
jgi:hypothetical protein